MISAGTHGQWGAHAGRGGSVLSLPQRALSPHWTALQLEGSAPARVPTTAPPAGAGVPLGEVVRRRLARGRTGEGCGGREGSRFVWVADGAREKRGMAAPSAASGPALQQKGLMAADRGRR